MTTLELHEVSENTYSPKEDNINLNWDERYVSSLVGLKIALSGFKNIFRRPLASIIKIGAAGYMINRGITGHCQIYAQLRKKTSKPVTITIHSATTIDRVRNDVYGFWRNLKNLPLFMSHIKSIDILDNGNSRWVMDLPTGLMTVSWDAEIINDVPGELLEWRSLPGSEISNSGTVRFINDPDNINGTLVDVVITYTPPAGQIGGSIAGIFNPIFKRTVDSDIKNFKAFMDEPEVLVLIEK